MSLSLSKNHEDKWRVEEWFHAFLNSEVGEVNDHFHAPVIFKADETAPHSNDWVGGWGSRRASTDALE